MAQVAVDLSVWVTVQYSPETIPLYEKLVQKSSL